MYKVYHIKDPRIQQNNYNHFHNIHLNNFHSNNYKVDTDSDTNSTINLTITSNTNAILTSSEDSIISGITSPGGIVGFVAAGVVIITVIIIISVYFSKKRFKNAPKRLKSATKLEVVNNAQQGGDKLDEDSEKAKMKDKESSSMEFHSDDV